MSTTIKPNASAWKYSEKILFRVFFIYFFIQAVPLDWKFYRELFSINWAHLYYGDIFNLAHYTPQFISGPQSYLNWVIALAIALTGAAIWTLADRNKERNYDSLYYWIRAIVRYRLAIALIAYGFIKLFPLQAPYPSISNLNTGYGYFDRWKLFSMSLGVVPSYELFLGFVEIIIGLSLLYRKTASIGAFIILIFTGNVFVSNIGYDGGEQVYSLYLISLAFFVLAWDLQRIVRLLILQKPTSPDRFKPFFDTKWQQYGRWIAKAGVVFLFVLLYGFKTRSAYHNDTFQYPREKGLAGASGIYNVEDFKLNDQFLPYSSTDPVRWQDVVFEKWNTISIRSNRPVIIDSNNTDRINREDKDRLYELEGTGGRHYYSYETDPVNHVLTLHNRNPHYAGETLVLTYSRPDNNHIVLSGTDQDKNPIYVVLDKINKKYLLEEAAKAGRRRGLKL